MGRLVYERESVLNLVTGAAVDLWKIDTKNYFSFIITCGTVHASSLLSLSFTVRFFSSLHFLFLFVSRKKKSQKVSIKEKNKMYEKKVIQIQTKRSLVSARSENECEKNTGRNEGRERKRERQIEIKKLISFFLLRWQRSFRFIFFRVAIKLTEPHESNE